jgi:hypothetical protein
MRHGLSRSECNAKNRRVISWSSVIFGVRARVAFYDAKPHRFRGYPRAVESRAHVVIAPQSRFRPIIRFISGEFVTQRVSIRRPGSRSKRRVLAALLRRLRRRGIGSQRAHPQRACGSTRAPHARSANERLITMQARSVVLNR